MLPPVSDYFRQGTEPGDDFDADDASESRTRDPRGLSSLGHGGGAERTARASDAARPADAAATADDKEAPAPLTRPGA